MTVDPLADYLTRFALLHTRDLDESRDVMGALWGKHEVEVIGPVPFETLVNHVEIAQLGLTYVRCPTRLRVCCTVGGERFTIRSVRRRCRCGRARRAAQPRGSRRGRNR